MAHELEIRQDGTAKFAYAATGGHPWHMLGTPMKGLSSIDDMLAAADANYEVRLVKVAAVDDYGNILRNPDNTPVMLDDSRATIRANIDGSFDGIATVGTRYTVKQNMEVAERALAVVGASRGDAVVDTAGVLLDGARFFMTLDLGPLVIDPTGVNDRIARYLVVSTGHDGVWPVRYANTDIRAVCNNTVRMGLRDAQRLFVARHTRNIESVLDDAQKVLEISTAWATEFSRMAEQMLRIPVPTSSNQVDKVLNAVFPEKTGETERQKANREKQQMMVRAVYHSEKNAAGFGYNAWSLFNAIGEYLDHHREAEPADRALASMDDNGWVTRTKLTAQEAVLALA